MGSVNNAILRGINLQDTALIFPTGWFRAWAVYSRAKEYNDWINDGSIFSPHLEDTEEPVSKGLMVW